MHCIACEKAGFLNNFTAKGGCTSFTLDSIKRHEGTVHHKSALTAPRQADEFHVVLANAIMLEVCADPLFSVVNACAQLLYKCHWQTTNSHS